jgi:hypothetical protein
MYVALSLVVFFLFAIHDKYTEHVAVQLFLDGGFRSLTLHIPVPWDVAMVQYHQQQGNRSKRIAGFLMNQCHHNFSRVLGRTTLQDIVIAVNLGAQLCVHNEKKGFEVRNTEIANGCDVLLAFTWAPAPTIIGGGSALLDIWRKCKSPKLHFSLRSLSLSSSPPPPYLHTVLLNNNSGGRKKRKVAND